MIRRSVLALLAVVAALTLSSCATFNRNDAVATVNGKELSRSDLADLLHNNIVQNQFVGALDQVQGTASTDQTDRVIGIWIALTVVEQRGLADLSGATEKGQLAGQYGKDFTDAPAKVQDLLTKFEAFHNTSASLDPAALHDAVRSANVHVDSRYGYWDPAQATVLPFGSPT